MGNKRAAGSRYEEKAAAFLQERGYQIVEKNYRERYGEIDLIARDGRYLVFVEVKFRRGAASGYPEEAVDARKQERIRHAATRYLCDRRYPADTPCRFDVVSILGEKFRLITDAF